MAIMAISMTNIIIITIIIIIIIIIIIVSSSSSSSSSLLLLLLLSLLLLFALASAGANAFMSDVVKEAVGLTQRGCRLGDRPTLQRPLSRCPKARARLNGKKLGRDDAQGAIVMLRARARERACRQTHLFAPQPPNRNLFVLPQCFKSPAVFY